MFSLVFAPKMQKCDFNIQSMLVALTANGGGGRAGGRGGGGGAGGRAGWGGGGGWGGPGGPLDHYIRRGRRQRRCGAAAFTPQGAS
jgi:hypothetical protein